MFEKLIKNIDCRFLCEFSGRGRSIQFCSHKYKLSRALYNIGTSVKDVGYNRLYQFKDLDGIYTKTMEIDSDRS